MVCAKESLRIVSPFIDASVAADEASFLDSASPWNIVYQSPILGASLTTQFISPATSPSPKGSSPSRAGPSSHSSPRTAVPAPLFCQICNKKFNSDKTLSAHLASAAHQAKVRSLSSPPSSKKQESSIPGLRESGNADSDDEDDSGEADDEKTLATAVSMAKSGQKIQLAQNSTKGPKNLSELDRAYRQYLGAAKRALVDLEFAVSKANYFAVYNQIWHVRDAATCFSSVLDLQRQILTSKLSLPVSVGKSSSSLISFNQLGREGTETGLLAHNMVLFKVHLYLARLLRATQPLLSLPHFRSCLEYVVAPPSFPTGEIPPSPRTINTWAQKVVIPILLVIETVDAQRKSSAASSGSSTFNSFGPELFEVVAEATSYLAALDHSVDGSVRVLLYCGILETLQDKYGQLARCDNFAAPRSSLT